jgi:hypothetical protein
VVWGHRHATNKILIPVGLEHRQAGRDSQNRRAASSANEEAVVVSSMIMLCLVRFTGWLALACGIEVVLDKDINDDASVLLQ